MQKMNIWYASAHDQPKGLSSRTYDFSRELVNRGHQVTMFTNSYCHWTHVDHLAPQEKYRMEEIDGIHVVWLRTIPYTGNGWDRGLNMLSNAFRLLQTGRIITHMPDVVIGPSVPLGTGWAAQRIAQMKGAAFVFEVRDVWPIALVHNGALSRQSLIYYMFRYVEKHLYRKAHRISVTMPFAHKHIFQSGGDPEKVVWIPNGVNFERFSGMDKYDGGNNSSLVAMYVGGIGAAHDVITIVRAANILQHKGNENVRFIIVGNGVKRAECEREASSLGLRNIEFRDAVPKSHVPVVQMEADVLIASVLDSAAYIFGINLNKLFDYFSSARPVIFSGNAPNDLVAQAGCGFTIQPEDPTAMADALEKLQKTSPSERISMGKRGRRYVEDRFDVRMLAERMEMLLSQAVKDRKA